MWECTEKQPCLRDHGWGLAKDRNARRVRIVLEKAILYWKDFHERNKVEVLKQSAWSWVPWSIFAKITISILPRQECDYWELLSIVLYSFSSLRLICGKESTESIVLPLVSLFGKCCPFRASAEYRGDALSASWCMAVVIIQSSKVYPFPFHRSDSSHSLGRCIGTTADGCLPFCHKRIVLVLKRHLEHSAGI